MTCKYSNMSKRQLSDFIGLSVCRSQSDLTNTMYTKELANKKEESFSWPYDKRAPPTLRAPDQQ